MSAQLWLNILAALIDKEMSRGLVYLTILDTYRVRREGGREGGGEGVEWILRYTD